MNNAYKLQIWNKWFSLKIKEAKIKTYIVKCLNNS